MSENYTCLCLGVTPGQGCGNDGVGDDFTGIFVNVSQGTLDQYFHPDRAPNRSGWVAVKDAPTAALSAIAVLVTKLAAKGVLKGTEPYDVFNTARPPMIRTGSGGDNTCLCLGVTPGGGCGNDGIGGDYLGIDLNVTQAQLDGGYHPDRAVPRTGWVAVKNQPTAALSVLLQVVNLLAHKGVLQGSDAFDVFNNSNPSMVRQIGGGDNTCLCLGVTPGGGCGNDGIGGDYLGIDLGVTQAQLDGNYHPDRVSPRTGWVAVHNDPNAALAVLAVLVTVLSKHGTLTGTEPWDVFNKSAPVRIRTWG